MRQSFDTKTDLRHPSLPIICWFQLRDFCDQSWRSFCHFKDLAGLSENMQNARKHQLTKISSECFGTKEPAVTLRLFCGALLSRGLGLSTEQQLWEEALPNSTYHSCMTAILIIWVMFTIIFLKAAILILKQANQIAQFPTTFLRNTTISRLGRESLRRVLWDLAQYNSKWGARCGWGVGAVFSNKSVKTYAKVSIGCYWF